MLKKKYAIEMYAQIWRIIQKMSNSFQAKKKRRKRRDYESYFHRNDEKKSHIFKITWVSQAPFVSA